MCDLSLSKQTIARNLSNILVLYRWQTNSNQHGSHPRRGFGPLRRRAGGTQIKMVFHIDPRSFRWSSKPLEETAVPFTTRLSSTAEASALWWLQQAWSPARASSTPTAWSATPTWWTRPTSSPTRVLRSSWALLCRPRRSWTASFIPVVMEALTGRSCTRWSTRATWTPSNSSTRTIFRPPLRRSNTLLSSSYCSKHLAYNRFGDSLLEEKKKQCFLKVEDSKAAQETIISFKKPIFLDHLRDYYRFTRKRKFKHSSLTCLSLQKLPVCRHNNNLLRWDKVAQKQFLNWTMRENLFSDECIALYWVPPAAWWRGSLPTWQPRSSTPTSPSSCRTSRRLSWTFSSILSMVWLTLWRFHLGMEISSLLTTTARACRAGYHLR